MARQEKTSAQIAAEIEKSYRKHKRQLEKSMKGTQEGSASRLNHIAGLAALDRKYREERAERGLDPVNLGVVQTANYVFTAYTQSTPVNDTAADRLVREELDKEFGVESERRQPTPEVEPKPKSKRGDKK